MSWAGQAQLAPGSRVADLIWRELAAGDAEQVASLIAVCEETDNPAYRTSPAEVHRMFAQPADVVSLGGFDAQGQLRAFGHVRLRGGDDLEALTKGAVHPQWRQRGIGLANLRWQVQAARAALLARPATSRRISIHVEDDRVNMIRHLEEFGYKRTASFVEWRRSLTQAIPTVATGQYLAIEPWTDKLDILAHAAYNEMQADSGASALDQTEWEQVRGEFMPAWSYVALDRSRDRTRVAGFVLVSRYEQDWDALGWTEGYIDFLVVFSAWRRTEVGTALVCAAMQACADDGMDGIALDVEEGTTETLTDELHDLGFRAGAASSVYTMYL